MTTKRIFLMLLILVSCKQEKSLYHSNSKDTSIVGELLDSSLITIQQQNYSLAKVILDTTYSLAKSKRDTIGLSSVLNNYGLLNYRLGNYQEGIRYYKLSLEIDQNLKDSSRIGRRLKNIGICYKQLGLFEKSLEFYLESLRIAQTSSEISEIASLNNSIGGLYNSIGDFDRSKEHFELALSLWSALEDYRRAVIAKNNLANALLGQDSFYVAIDIYSEVLEEKYQLGNNASIAITLNNLGEAYKEINEIDKARQNFDRSLLIKKQIGDRKGISIASNNLAQLDLIEGKLNSAREHIQIALDNLENLPLSDEKLRSLDLLKSINIAEKEYYQALIVDTLLDIKRNRLFEDQRLNVMAQMNNYELDVARAKKEKAEKLALFNEKLGKQQRLIIWGIASGLVLTIILLLVIERGKRLQKKQNGEILILNDKLATLLEEVKHRKSNDFNRLLAIIDIMSEEQPELKELLNPVNHIVLTTFDLDEFLESQNKMIRINFAGHLNALVKRLEKKYTSEAKKFDITIKCEEVKMNSKIATALSYITCELFNNTIKHGIFKTHIPFIGFEVHSVNNEVFFKYNDNGDIPLTEETLNESKGIGWNILNSFVKSIHGSLEVTRSQNLNTFCIRFKNEPL